MIYHQTEFPSLGGQTGDGFKHMVEADKDNEELQEASSSLEKDESEKLKDIKITELEAQLAETRTKLEMAKSTKSCDIPQQLFDYDVDKDEVIIKDNEGFEKFVDDKCTARQGRDRRKIELKNKMLGQVREFERRKRDLSTDSICLSFSGSPSRVRLRSGSDGEGADSKQSKLCKGQPVKS